MTRRGAIVGAIVLCAVVVAAYFTRPYWMPGGAAPGGARVRAVSVLTATAELKPIPVDVDAIGTVATIQSVAIKSRIETMIDNVNFEDGAKVSAGDILFNLDARQIDAQISQAEGVVTKDQAQLAGAERDFSALQ